MKKKVILTIGGMECPNCAMNLERIEDRITGVCRASASYPRSTLVVEFVSEQVTEEMLRSEVRRLGYEVVEIRPG